MYLRDNGPDPGSVLAALARNIQHFGDEVDLYLKRTADYEMIDPFQAGAQAAVREINGTIPHRFWEKLGIRHIISSAEERRPATENLTIPYSWKDVKNGAIIETLGTVFSNSSIIQFADWVKVQEASGFWDGLFRDVIKPLNKRDFEFIFYPGDVSKKLVFEVDEFLDIMGDYASYGRVTLVLDEEEAGQLWSRLNGRASYATSSGFRSPGAREKYLFLFNTMKIDVLLIAGDNRTVLLSRDGQFDLSGRPFNKTGIPGDSKEYFNAGYLLGLLLHLEIPHCAALGLAVSGAYAEQASIPGSKELVSYINDWMAELQFDGVLKNDF